jgi:hypothetical protein
MHNSIAMDFVPVGTVLLVALTAASTAYIIHRRATPGRARDAVAYQVGFLAALATTLGLANVLSSFAIDAPVAQAGMIASFVGPFAGIAQAKLRTLAQKKELARPSAAETGAAADTFLPFRRFLESLPANPGTVHQDR